MRFDELGLSQPVLQAVLEAGYTTPTPIQEQAIPYVLMGRDVLGVAQTGTGKTAGFTLPMIEVLSQGRGRARMPRSLILEPTRELAHQVADSFEKYGKHCKLSMALLIGGESMRDQQAILQRGVDVLIATPGRLLDLFERGMILLADTKLLVIDEADRMLDMGFVPDVERIVSLLPPLRQTLFFSATMAPEIRRLSDAFLSNPKEISVSPEASAATTVRQRIVRCGSKDADKRAALRALIDRDLPDMQSAIVFCNRKRDVAVVLRSMQRYGYSVEALHGDLAQPARMAALGRFRAGEVKILICSDVAARGLDIPAVSHVFNYDVPHHAEDYIHRIGRTGRAGRAGKAFTLVTPEDAKSLASVVRLIGRPIDEDLVEGVAPAAAEEGGEPAPSRRRSAGRGGEDRGTRRTPSDRHRRPERTPAEQTQAPTESEQSAPEQAAPEQAAPEQAAPEERARPARTNQERTTRERSRPARSRVHEEGGEEFQPNPANNNSPFGDHTPAFILRPVRTAALG